MFQTAKLTFKVIQDHW